MTMNVALAQLAPNHRSCLMVMVSAFFFRDRSRLAELALRQRIVSMFGFREWAGAGGLLSYGPNIVDMHRRVADYVDRIAKGTKPADLPIEQPSKFEFIVNLKTARAIGIEMPTSILLRAKSTRRLRTSRSFELAHSSSGPALTPGAPNNSRRWRRADQSQDRQGARPRNSADTARRRRRGD